MILGALTTGILVVFATTFIVEAYMERAEAARYPHVAWEAQRALEACLNSTATTLAFWTASTEPHDPTSVATDPRARDRTAFVRDIARAASETTGALQAWGPFLSARLYQRAFVDAFALVTRRLRHLDRNVRDEGLGGAGPRMARLELEDAAALIDEALATKRLERQDLVSASVRLPRWRVLARRVLPAFDRERLRLASQASSNRGLPTWSRGEWGKVC